MSLDPQCAFAVITGALISGATVGRMKFSSYVVFLALWTTLVVCSAARFASPRPIYESTTVSFFPKHPEPVTAVDTVQYDPLVHWMWCSNGWLREYGAVDFAGELTATGP